MSGGSTDGRTARVLTSALNFPEGPVHLGDGTVACVEMQGQRITRVHASGARAGECEVLADLGGAPNGATLGADGALYVANNGGLSINADGSYWHAAAPFDGGVQRISSGTGSTFSGPLPGDAPHRPNDICTGPDGALYVTDSSNWENMRELRAGRIVRVAADGSATLAAELAAMPNGIAFGPDGRTLLVAQSLTRRIWAYPWSDGELGEPVEHARLASGTSPDGMCFDADGLLYVCTSIGDSVCVLSPEGEVIETIPTGPGSQPTNCCIGDGQLYVTLAKRNEMVAFEIGKDALALHGGAWVR